MRVNNQSTGWDQAGHFMASTNFLNQMWLPDIQVCEVSNLHWHSPCPLQDLHVQAVPQASDRDRRGGPDHIPEQAGALHRLHGGHHRLSYEVRCLPSGPATLQVSGKWKTEEHHNKGGYLSFYFVCSVWSGCLMHCPRSEVIFTTTLR